MGDGKAPPGPYLFCSYVPLYDEVMTRMRSAIYFLLAGLFWLVVMGAVLLLIILSAHMNLQFGPYN